MDWKAILALAVLTTPIAYCTMNQVRAEEESNALIAEACLESGHIWHPGWGGWCGARE
jgi:hypothetical protein